MPPVATTCAGSGEEVVRWPCSGAGGCWLATGMVIWTEKWSQWVGIWHIYILLGERVFIQYYPWAISWAERSYWFWYVLIAVSDFLGWWPQAWVFLHHAWDSLLSSYQNGAAIDYQYMPQRTNPKPHALPKILACFSVFCFPEQMTVYTVYKVKRINTTVLIFVSWGDVPCKEHILEMNWKGSTHADVVSHVQTPIG